jgi:magnesium-transporting ATPase (P-type)
VAFTATPVMIRAIMEMDLSEAVAETFPGLYRSGAANEYFSFQTISNASLLATYHAIVVTIVPLLLFGQGDVMDLDGQHTGDLWTTSVASFFYVVPIVHFQIYFETWSWTAAVKWTYLTSFVFFFVCIASYDQTDSMVHGALSTIITTPRFWLGFALSMSIYLVPWLAYKGYVVHVERRKRLNCVCRFRENFITTAPVDILRRVRFYNKIGDANQANLVGNTVASFSRTEAKSAKAK